MDEWQALGAQVSVPLDSTRTHRPAQQQCRHDQHSEPEPDRLLPPPAALGGRLLRQHRTRRLGLVLRSAAPTFGAGGKDLGASSCGERNSRGGRRRPAM
jgi:hypothetical protein